MINFNELKKGDHVLASNDGDSRRGEVENLNGDEKQVCVNTGQAFWYETNQLFPISLSEGELTNFKFHKHVNDDGTIKYMKGAFRMLIPGEGDFSRMEIWYRDEQRHIAEPVSLHILQNHFYEMTKVFLNDKSFD
jgi:hypothetical protein